MTGVHDLGGSTGRRLRWAAPLFLALVALLVAVPQARAIHAAGVCSSGATPRPCYTDFEVDGGAHG